jgi:cell division protein FtsN
MTLHNDHNTDEIGAFYASKTRKMDEGRKRLSPFMLALILTFGFVAVVWFAYPKAGSDQASSDVPVIRADSEPYKVVPEDEGGMDVPHQDSTVFNAIDGETDHLKVEKIIPPTEQPIQAETPDTALAETTKTETAIAEVPALNLATVEQTEGAPKTETIKAPEAVDQQAASVAKAAVETKKAITRTAGGVYIQLGAFKSAEIAEKEWLSLSKKFPSELSGLEHRVVKAELPKGIFYRLQAGTLAPTDAANICKNISAKNPAGCIIAK